MLDKTDIKRALRDAGFEVYRTRGDTVHVAERVRENLIMDAGISVDGAASVVSFTARAEATRFPDRDEETLFGLARDCGSCALERGYTEARSFVTPLPDPSDPERAIDHWYQVQYDKPVESIGGAVEEVAYALGLDKNAKK